MYCFAQMTYEVKKVCSCEFLDDKNAPRRLFRIIRLGKDGNYKNVDFEAPQAMASKYVPQTSSYKCHIYGQDGYKPWLAVRAL